VARNGQPGHEIEGDHATRYTRGEEPEFALEDRDNMVQNPFADGLADDP
jgi:hypothetical protein